MFTWSQEAQTTQATYASHIFCLRQGPAGENILYDCFFV
jgi:hypothetical protein